LLALSKAGEAACGPQKGKATQSASHGEQGTCHAIANSFLAGDGMRFADALCEPLTLSHLDEEPKAKEQPLQKGGDGGDVPTFSEAG